MRKLHLGLMLGVCVMMGACSGGQEALPTLLPDVPDGQATPLPAEDATPTPEELVVDAMPTATTARTRPTLPPTFTPTVLPTEEPTATQVFAPPTPFVSAATPDPNCTLFVTQFETSTTQFEIGASPRASWSAVPGAELYRVIVRQDNDRVVTDEIYVAETTYEFPPNFFAPGAVYGWEVYPINARGDQMCFSIGSILIPVTPIAIPSGP